MHGCVHRLCARVIATCQAFAVQCCAMSRKYELKRRAERQSETRHRIVAATVELHTSVGPARTTISAIADRAGVQRHTVYAHFPDEQSALQGVLDALARASSVCRTAAAGSDIADPARRLRTALPERLRVVRARRGRPRDLQSRRGGPRAHGRARRPAGAGDRVAAERNSRTAGLGAGRCRPRSAMHSTSRPGAR